MSTKIDKKELKRPDAFLSFSEKVFHQLQKHSLSLSLLVGAIVLIGLGYAGYSLIQSRAEKSAAEALYGPESALKKAEASLRDERAKKMQALAGLNTKAKEKLKPETLRPANFAADFQPVVESFKAQLKAHADTRAAVVAASNLSYFLIEQKQYAEALEVLNLPKYKPSQNDLLGGLMSMHKGLALMENQKFDEAAKIYQSVIEASNLKPFHPEAMLKLGVAFEQKGDSEKARQTYEKLGREYPDTESSVSAEQYLRLLNLKSQQG